MLVWLQTVYAYGSLCLQYGLCQVNEVTRAYCYLRRNMQCEELRTDKKDRQSREKRSALE